MRRFRNPCLKSETLRLRSGQAAGTHFLGGAGKQQIRGGNDRKNGKNGRSLRAREAGSSLRSECNQKGNGNGKGNGKCKGIDKGAPAFPAVRLPGGLGLKGGGTTLPALVRCLCWLT